jgi:hypothetical protein
VIVGILLLLSPNSLPHFALPLAQQLLGVTHQSAQRNVGKLVQAGVRQVGERAYGKVFIAERILEVIQGRNT